MQAAPFDLLIENFKATMADAVAPAPTPSPAKKVAKPKKPAVKPDHPQYSVMITAAITALKERGGSSRPAILKHILANNKNADSTKAQVLTTRSIRKMLDANKLVQIKGSFKLPKEEPKPKKVKKVVKKPVKKAKKPSAKKVVKKTS